MSDDGKKVGQQLTLSVPANHAAFRRHIDAGLRRQGFFTQAEREAAQRPRKGCQKLSRTATRTGLQGPRNALHELVPPDTPPAHLDFLTGRWEERQGELGAVEVELRGDWMPDASAVWAAPNRDRPALVDRRGQWKPLGPAQERPLRRAMYVLRDGIRVISQPRCQACGRAVISPNGSVGVLVTDDGRVRLTGLAHCGSVWECPTCQMTICQARARELRTAVERHGADRVAMMTLTIRHGAGDNLRQLRTELSRAFAAFSRHRAFKRWKREVGIIGRVRAVEVTHGPNGWHPHLHVLFFFDRPVERAWVDGGTRAVWDPPDLGALVALWRTQVRRIFGARHEPDDEHAIATTLASDGEYISKLGLELSDPANKKAERGHRTPWQIASDFARAYNAARDARDREAGKLAAGRLLVSRDADLWRTYCRDMRGAHRLVWSNGLKGELGIADTSDADLLADDEEPGTGDTWIASIPKLAWDGIRDRRVRGEPAAHYLIRVAERGGSEAFDRALLELAAGER